MIKWLSMVGVLLLSAACAAPQNAGFSGGQPNILILGEDADSDSVPRDSRVFKRVLDALANAMNEEGFDVYDETAITLNGFAQGRVGRTDAEIIDIARAVKRPPIDVAVILEIHTLAQQRGYTNKIQVRIAGRLLNVRSGKRLGNFEVELPEPDTVSPDCGRHCALEAVGRNARVLAQDLGAVLARKLDWLSPPARRSVSRETRGQSGGLATAYTIVFSGFRPREITEIEDRITAFLGYKHLRPIRSSLRTNEYWYETSILSTQLNRELRFMLDSMGVEGRVVYGGNRFAVEKITYRNRR